MWYGIVLFVYSFPFLFFIYLGVISSCIHLFLYMLFLFYVIVRQRFHNLTWNLCDVTRIFLPVSLQSSSFFPLSSYRTLSGPDASILILESDASANYRDSWSRIFFPAIPPSGKIRVSKLVTIWQAVRRCGRLLTSVLLFHYSSSNTCTTLSLLK